MRQCSRTASARNLQLRERFGGIPRALLVSLICAGLQACALLPQPEILPPGSEPKIELAAPADSVRFEVDSARLILHTYRAGWLARLAHNHVITSNALRGTIYLAEPISASSARLAFRPWDLVLDDAAARAGAGAGFESVRSSRDIEATRRRMLGPRGFASNDFPSVMVLVSWIDHSSVALEIEFRDQTIHESVPVSWSLEGARLQVSADFELSHRAFGIRPYSAFAGAIAVAERIRIQLALSARQLPDS